jgi:hypothetical protein
VVEAQNPPRLETSLESRVGINRLGSQIEMSIRGVYAETPEGTLTRVVSEIRMSAQTLKTEAEIKEGEIALKTWSGDRAFSQTIAYQGSLKGPEGIRRLSVQSLNREGDRMDYQTFAPELNVVLNTTRTAAGWEEITVLGKTVLSLRVTEASIEYPVNRTLWLDKDGNELKSLEPSPFGEVTAVLATRDEALEKTGGGAGLREQFRNTLVRSNVRLPQARLIEAVTLKLKHRKPELGWPDLGGPYQNVLREDRDHLVLEVRRPRVDRNNRASIDNEAFLRANAYLDKDDPLVQKTARDVAGGEKDDFRKAVLLRNWVSDHVKFDLGIAFAPSSEAIRSLRGTCTEYAILLTTLCRAAGIPARYLTGFAYLNGVWGGHAWTEVFIDGTWLPLDAAVSGPGIADAARFYLSASTLDSGPAGAVASWQQMFGSVDIEVTQYKLKDETFKIKPDQPLYDIKGDRYDNPGLGLGISKPAGFTFLNMDKTWPESILLTMKGPADETVNVYQEPLPPQKDAQAWCHSLLDRRIPNGAKSPAKLLGRPAFRSSSRDKSAIAFPNGVDVWVIESQGAQHRPILEQITKTFSLKRLLAVPKRE